MVFGTYVLSSSYKGVRKRKKWFPCDVAMVAKKSYKVANSPIFGNQNVKVHVISLLMVSHIHQLYLEHAAPKPPLLNMGP